jgi:hypothetical protein
MNTLQKAAKRVVRKHNDLLRQGFAGKGCLVFSMDGQGGTYYKSAPPRFGSGEFANNSYPAGNSCLIVFMRRGEMTISEAKKLIRFQSPAL